MIFFFPKSASLLEFSNLVLVSDSPSIHIWFYREDTVSPRVLFTVCIVLCSSTFSVILPRRSCQKGSCSNNSSPSTPSTPDPPNFSSLGSSKWHLESNHSSQPLLTSLQIGHYTRTATSASNWLPTPTLDVLIVHPPCCNLCCQGQSWACHSPT